MSSKKHCDLCDEVIEKSFDNMIVNDLKYSIIIHNKLGHILEVCKKCVIKQLKEISKA